MYPPEEYDSERLGVPASRCHTKRQVGWNADSSSWLTSFDTLEADSSFSTSSMRLSRIRSRS
ncbi:hypothetical protein D3C83_324970 [compost metagenome]